ncbi:C-type lectin domain family 12 member A-like isoform X4 [Ambystoma mexicanum]|uniref:C-type lectin domain family 12 member A-like isoform X4 n=1 Tax=Ambystoma mexicanum TaxID=8296 RepID=UPI0037E74FDB
MKSSDSMYQNLQFKDKDPNSTVDELKSAGDTSTSKDVQVLQKKLRIWRIVTTILLMFIILAVIIAITIFYMKGKKQNTGEAELQKLKANICIANVLLELLQNTMLQGGVEAKKHPDTTCKYCASNWIHHSGSCYFFSTALMNWTESRDSCRRMNSQFVKIQSQDKQVLAASFHHQICNLIKSKYQEVTEEFVLLWTVKTEQHLKICPGSFPQKSYMSPNQDLHLDLYLN